MGSLESVPWHDLPIIGDLGGALAQTGIYSEVWLPAWDIFATSVNFILGQDVLWHR